MFRLFVVALFLLVSSISSAQAWPQKGTFFTKGCEKMDASLKTHFEGMSAEAKKKGETFEVLAKLCLTGELHVVAKFIMIAEQRMIEVEIYSIYSVIQDKKGRPVIDVRMRGAKLIGYHDFPSQSAEKK